jgi:hypothetical protein
MPRFHQQIGHIRVTQNALLPAGERDGFRLKFLKDRTAIVAILAKTVRNSELPKHKESHNTQQKQQESSP